MPQTIVSIMGRLSRKHNSFKVMKKTVRRERKRERAVWRDLGMKAGIGCIPCTSQPLSHSASILRPDPTTPA
jgi:hypothetical protein